MSNPSKRKGTAWETAVCGYLNERGLIVERRALAGAKDKGDIAGVPGWALECKAEKTISLAAYVDEANTEAVHAGVPRGAAIVKRRQRGTAQSYVVMDLATFADVLLETSAA